MIDKQKLHSFNRVNLSEQIADYIEQMILDAGDTEWSPAAKLPSEHELADSFGVSRNVVREAIKLLKERGLVEPQNGVGAYVTKPDESKLSLMFYRYLLMNDVDAGSIYDTRILLEVHAAEGAAANRTDDDLQYMHSLLEKLKDRSISVNERRETDFDFHLAISKASGNTLNTLLESALKDVWIAMIEKGIFHEHGIDDAIMRHERIMRALENRDVKGAGIAMRDHLKGSLELVEWYDEPESESQRQA